MDFQSDIRIRKSRPTTIWSVEKNLNGITNTMLSSTLKTLEDKGIVDRKQYNEVPLRVEYSLTEAGKAMLHIYYEIAKWGSTYLSH